MLDWLIVGGGVHGTHLFLALTQGARQNVAVLDPEAEPLAQFWRCVAACGMGRLRSPAVHHLDLEPWSLVDLAEERAEPSALAPPYGRPSVALFRAHCEGLVAHSGLRDRWIRGRATRIVPGPDRVLVQSTAGPLQARRVALALGMGEQLSIPRWALAAPRSDRLRHLYEPAFDPGRISAGDRVLVVGLGIGGVHLALSCAERAKVTLASRHPLERSWFDSDPGWLGPKNMRGFAAETDWTRRRDQISQARKRGSVPPDLAAALREQIRAGRIERLSVEPERALPGEGGVGVVLGGELRVFEHVVLATGFVQSRPGGALVDELVQRHGLPVAPCGYPIVGPDLAWHPRIACTGALAELELGPTARNISGARKAAVRLVEASLQATG
jgi:cation diffusion facilitator CzcD-associated flavoprotein CzcO